MNKIFTIFFLVTIVSLVMFILVFYKDKQFQKNPLPQEVIQELQQKNSQIKNKILQLYNKNISIPIIIQDQLPNNLFGLASYKKGTIKIFLNKKRFQENASYMINYVLPHEYAHALMFYYGNFTKENGGHTKMWQKFCLDIGGLKCDRFVDHNDILIEKLGGIY